MPPVGPAVRRWLAAAGPRWWLLPAGLTLLALGLPWTSGRQGYDVPGWFAPGSCVTVYDADGYASMDCSAGYYSPGWHTSGAAALPGFATEMRVFVVVAAVLLAVGLRRGSRRVFGVGLLVAAAGFALNLGGSAGQLVFTVALAIAVAYWRAMPRIGQPSAASTSPATSRIRSSPIAP